MNDMEAAKRALAEMTLGEVAGRVVGPPSSARIGAFGKGLNTATLGMMPKTVGRFAGSGLGRGILRAMPGVGIASTALAAGDIVLGDESMANKGFDALGMGGGALAGFLVGGPLGATIGAGIGKSAMDGAQSLMGVDRASEQRKMEEAIAMLRGGMG